MPRTRGRAGGAVGPRVTTNTQQTEAGRHPESASDPRLHTQLYPHTSEHKHRHHTHTAFKKKEG